MIFVKIFFTTLVWGYDNFCQSCCHQCCKKKDNTEELLNYEGLHYNNNTDKIIPDSYSNNKQTEESLDDIQYENREQNFDYIREKRIQNVSDGLLSGDYNSAKERIQNLDSKIKQTGKSIDDPYIQYENREQNFDPIGEKGKRIKYVYHALFLDDYNSAEEIIQKFDSKIKRTEESIDQKNPYIQHKDEGYKQYFNQLKNKHAQNVEAIVEDQKPDFNYKRENFTKLIKNILRQIVEINIVYFYDTDEIKYGFLSKFEEIKGMFLGELKQKNSVLFRWYPNNIVTDSGGPSRQLLSVFYQNLLKQEINKLTNKNAENIDYLVFNSYMNYDDAMMLGQLAFLSLTKESSMEYNLPEVYYKIMLHDEDENLEDYLTLADFKTMIGIMKETKDGKTVDGRYLIPVDIKINPNKDRVFLKYAKEEVYKIYLRLYQEDDVKNFEAFKDNFEEEIAKLMFERLGIKIKKVLNGFIDGYQLYLNKILNYLSNYGIEQLLKDIKPFERIEDINTTAKNTEEPLLSLRQCLRKSEFRPKDLKIYIEGEPVASVEDLMNHFDVGYNNQDFTKNDIADIVKKKIQGSDKRSQKKFFEQLSFLLTGSRIFTGKVKVYIEDINGPLKIATCSNTLTLDAKNPKGSFEEVLEASDHAEDYCFNDQ